MYVLFLVAWAVPRAMQCQRIKSSSPLFCPSPNFVWGLPPIRASSAILNSKATNANADAFQAPEVTAADPQSGVPLNRPILSLCHHSYSCLCLRGGGDQHRPTTHTSTLLQTLHRLIETCTSRSVDGSPVAPGIESRIQPLRQHRQKRLRASVGLASALRRYLRGLEDSCVYSLSLTKLLLDSTCTVTPTDLQEGLTPIALK